MKYLMTFHLKKHLKFFLCFFIIAYCNNLSAQNPSGITFSWNSDVGCQVFIPPKDHGVIVEAIQASDCIRVCEKSSVQYTLSGFDYPSFNVHWTVTGGTFTTLESPETTSVIQVQWGSSGPGSITFSYTDANGNLVTKTQCFEKINIPKALFSVHPLEETNDIKPYVLACTDQNLYFNDLSVMTGQSPILNWFWDFGDAANNSNFSSTAQNPTHVYTTQGDYFATLTVTNACGCSSSFRRRIVIKGENGFEISCPSIVCEGQTSHYSLPEEAQLACNEFHYSCEGGTVTDINQDDGSVQVIWDHVDASGFGFLTFQTQTGSCNLPCLSPTTIRVPVIKNIGTIQGPSSICLGGQGIFHLPQWPTTEFIWEIVGNENGNLATVHDLDQRNEFLVVPLITGTLTLRVVYTNTLLHCGGTATFTINVINGIDFEGDVKLCQNSAASYHTLDDTPTTWTLTNALGAIVQTQSNTANFDYTFSDPGTYTLSVGYLGACPGHQKEIVVTAIPDPIGINDVRVLTTTEENAATTAVCPNIFYNYSLPSNPAVQYHWSVTNGTLSGSSIGDEVTVKFTGTAPALLTVYSESTSPSICASSPVTIPISIKQINATLLNANTTVCANSTASYQVNLTGSSDLYTEGESYFWSLSNPNLGSITNGQDSNQINIMWNNVNVTTTVNLNLVIYKCGGSRTLTLPITIIKVPVITITPASTTVCGGTAISFTVASNSPPIVLDPSNTVVWNFGYGEVLGGLTSPLTNFYNLEGDTNITQNVTAYIVNPNGCLGTTPTVHATVTVLPSPLVSNSLASTANTFCYLSDINVDLVASVSTDVISIQWYGPSGVPILNATSSTLHANTSTGFGDYYFVATNSLGCSSASNTETIHQGCDCVNCPLNPNVLNNNSTQTCGVITLSSEVGGTPTATNWEVYGPDGSHSVIEGATYTPTLPGTYHNIIYASYYNELLQTTCTYSKDKLITVPFIASFVQTVICNSNNNFTVSLIDTSSYYAGVAANCVLQYAYRSTSASVNDPFTNITGTSVTLNSGDYDLRLTITYNGQSCSVINSFSYSTIPDNQSVTVAQPACYDSTANFGFTSTILTTDNCLWTFEPGVENTLQFPKRVFNTSGLHSVSVVLTNKYGCSRLFDNIQVNVPVKCFNGDVVVSPNPAIVCKGSSVTLSYQPNADACVPTQYIWMNGNQEMTNYGNTSSIQVFNPGIYWVKVKRGLCSYDTPSRITPQFINPPSLKISGPLSICNGSEAQFTAVSNGDTIKWLIDEVWNPDYDGLWSITIGNLSVQTHIVKALVTISNTDCPAIVTQNLQVLPTPNVPVIDQNVFCTGDDPEHPYYHIQLNAASNVSQYFNWSNGMSGTNITVNDGGLYQVTVNSGGCSASSSIVVPKNLEDYMWVVPTGCYSFCKAEGMDQVILGPTVIVKEWDWLFSDTLVDSGTNSIPSNLNPSDTGIYQLSLSNEDCTVLSPRLNYSIEKSCISCKIELVKQLKVKYNEGGNCSFTVDLNIISSDNLAVTLVAVDNSALLIPSNLSVTLGSANYSINVFPLNNFDGGIIPIQLQGTDEHGALCVYEFQIKLPSCHLEPVEVKAKGIQKEQSPLQVQLAPNPANEAVTISYKGIVLPGSLSLYDLMGHQLKEFPLNATEGALEMTTKEFPAGVYLVVLKTNEGWINQQKLIIE
ncbi:PKD domain-containing protein [Flavobacterium sp. SUN046]|uniref:PKD domain-containing protein n=1 Tax=Flavobacterium sp. SUN046 TaxID=3002440 RepID=UPI002DBB6898|nr:PKD domain-containing protein [Flavobacterium sp. SUN046]MEC4050289.1 PKD domain-containing protein [Flavobacterium sp. SUN046]